MELFSILHPSARPHKWREIYEAWIGAAAHPKNVEYVLCADERWGFPGPESIATDPATGVLLSTGQAFWPNAPKLERGNSLKPVWNTARRCYVDSVNTAAKASRGRILIVIADDQWPCERWDEELTRVLSNPLHDVPWAEWGTKQEFVVQVSTGTPHEHERRIIVMPILSRTRYERLGYVFYPEYESAFADNDFYAHAVKDKCLITARHLMFPHKHPLTEPGAWEKRADGKWIDTDEAYAAQNRRGAYLIGEEVFRRRVDSGFTDIKLGPQDRVDLARDTQTIRQPSRVTKGSIALALPGEAFHHVWVAKLIEIIPALLMEGWNYTAFLLHCSEPGITRATISNAVKEMKEKGQFKADYILWMDDDQIVEAQQVLMLINDLEQLPHIDMIAGWTWIASSGPHFNDPQVSCGQMDLSKGELSHAEYKSVQSADGVFEVGWTGFPLVLMRTSCLDKVGKHPFSHYPCPESPWGECGEDISFCKRLRDAGGRIYVDSRVFVPHLKLKALGPVPASKEEIALALTGSGSKPKAATNGVDLSKELASVFENYT